MVQYSLKWSPTPAVKSNLDATPSKFAYSAAQMNFPIFLLGFINSTIDWNDNHPDQGNDLALTFYTLESRRDVNAVVNTKQTRVVLVSMENSNVWVDKTHLSDGLFLLAANTET